MSALSQSHPLLLEAPCSISSLICASKLLQECLQPGPGRGWHVLLLVRLGHPKTSRIRPPGEVPPGASGGPEETPRLCTLRGQRSLNSQRQAQAWEHSSCLVNRCLGVPGDAVALHRPVFPFVARVHENGSCTFTAPAACFSAGLRHQAALQSDIRTLFPFLYL